MDLRFLAQPFSAEGQLGPRVRDALELAGRDRFRFASAWGKRSGLSRIADAIESFRARGGSVEAILGIDEGGATREGLELAVELFDETYVYHDPGTRTFHPKVYVIEGPSTADVFVGSSNLTKGGLFTNYEASTWATVDRAVAAESAFLADVHGYLDALLASDPACRLLSVELVEELARDPRYRIFSEAGQNRRRAERSAAASPAPGIFGTAVTGLTGAPAARIPTPLHDEADDDSVPGAAAGEDPGAATDAGPTGFWKRLSNFDASESGAPGQIIIPIRFLDFFPAMTVQMDKTATGGVRQSHVEFPATFVDGSFEKRVETGRAILYEPAADHPRRNKELRFTFRDTGIRARLQSGDVLVFTRDDRGEVRVERRAPGAMGSRRWGELS